jgi:hypothetical protein
MKQIQELNWVQSCVQLKLGPVETGTLGQKSGKTSATLLFLRAAERGSGC